MRYTLFGLTHHGEQGLKVAQTERDPCASFPDDP